MTDAAAPMPSAAPASAPTTAPSTSGGATPAPAPSSPATPAMGGAPSPPSGQQTPAPTQAEQRAAVLWKTRVRLPDREDEIETEIDVDPFLREYKRKVKIDGREHEVPVEEAFKSYERLRSSMKRYDEAAQARKEAEAIRTQMQEREKAIDAALRDPRRVLDIARRTLGEDAFMAAIAQEVRARLEYEQLPPEQRQHRDQMTAAERKVMERERELQQREREIAKRQQEVEAAREQRIAALAKERQQQMIAEWVPALEAAGLPAKVNGQPNQRMIQMLADTMSRAKRAGMPLTLPEAISTVREEFEQMVGPVLQQRQQAALAAAQAQPGRGEVQAPPPGGRIPPAPAHRETAEEYERRLRASWRR